MLNLPGIDLVLPLISQKVRGLCTVIAWQRKIASFLEMS